MPGTERSSLASASGCPTRARSPVTAPGSGLRVCFGLRPRPPEFVPAKIDHLARESNPFSIFFPDRFPEMKRRPASPGKGWERKANSDPLFHCERIILRPPEAFHAEKLPPSDETPRAGSRTCPGGVSRVMPAGLVDRKAHGGGNLGHRTPCAVYAPGGASGIGYRDLHSPRGSRWPTPESCL